jgi:D-alanine-D-alanine ligase
MGGPDAERDVSIMSGTQVAEALRQSVQFEVVEKTIDAPSFLELKAMAGGCDVVFPVLHGHWGEGGPLQEELEKLGLPYVGSKPQPARRAMDKLVTKSLLANDHIPTPRSRQLLAGDECDLQPPIVLKPVDDGSSVDLRICRTIADIEKARRELHPKRGRLMAEQYIAGREITVGILIDTALPLIEIIPSKAVDFYDYQAKYTRDDTQYVVEPKLTARVTEQCQHIAMTAFERLGCRDVARVDFILDDRGPWFLEINTMPGFTTHSLLPMAARHIGLGMPELCAKLVKTALARTDSQTPKRARKAAHASSQRGF